MENSPVDNVSSEEENIEEVPDEEDDSFINHYPVEFQHQLFRPLDLLSLINLSNTCRMLRNSFLSYLPLLHIFVFQISHINSRVMEFEQTRELVILGGLRFILPMVRLFGDRITILQIDFSQAFQLDSMLVSRYVNEYMENLHTIDFANVVYNVSLVFDRCFSNVHEVSFKNCWLCSTLCNLKRHFPNLRTLGFIENNHIESTLNFFVNYPRLVTLEVSLLTLSFHGIERFSRHNPGVIIRTFNELGLEIDYRDYV